MGLLNFFKKPNSSNSALEKFRAIIKAEREYMEFMVSDDYEGITGELAANKALYKGYDEAVKEGLSDQEKQEINKLDERIHVNQKLQSEVENGNITKEEFIEIVNSDEYNEYTK
jgi:hypothetical protein